MIKITIFNENKHEQELPEIRAVYPDGIHGCLKEFLGRETDFEVAHIATFDMPEHGLTKEVLEDTDVLIFWNHALQSEFSDQVAARVRKYVLLGMGLVALHSSHYSKVMRMLLGTTMTLRWQDDNEEILHVTAPTHPIAAGIPARIHLPKEEMYGEYFDIPKPDDVIFTGWFAGGEVFRSGVTFTRGLGKIFYFQPGHEAYPIYYMPEIQKIIVNSVRWAKKNEELSFCNPSIEDKVLPYPLENVEIKEKKIILKKERKLSVFWDHIVEAVEQSGLTLNQVLKRVKEAGIDAVEIRLCQLLEKETDIAAALMAAGLRISSIYEFYDWSDTEQSVVKTAVKDIAKSIRNAKESDDNGGTSDEVQWDKLERIAKKQVDIAERYQVEKLLIVPGFLKEKEAEKLKALNDKIQIYTYMDESKAVQKMVEGLQNTVQYANTKGIDVSLEDFDGNTAAFARGYELLYFMNHVRGLKYTLDTGNFAYSDEDAGEMLDILQDYIVHVHCKDRGYEDHMTGKVNKGLAPVAVGAGYIPIEEYVKRVENLGYDGYFAIEHFGSKVQLQDMERSAAYLKGL